MRWNEELESILQDNESLTKEQIAEKLATSLANSKHELLISFKVAYGQSLKNVGMILTKFCPEKSEKEIRDIIYVFFPFMFGIYPYTAVTDKQQDAMKQANVDYVYQSVFEITNNCLLKLL